MGNRAGKPRYGSRGGTGVDRATGAGGRSVRKKLSPEERTAAFRSGGRRGGQVTAAKRKAEREAAAKAKAKTKAGGGGSKKKSVTPKSKAPPKPKAEKKGKGKKKAASPVDKFKEMGEKGRATYLNGIARSMKTGNLAERRAAWTQYQSAVSTMKEAGLGHGGHRVERKPFGLGN